MCLVVGASASPAGIRDISGRGAFLETHQRPPLGTSIELRHPEAGSIRGEVSSLGRDGIGISFVLNSRAIAFALATIAADMSRPAR
jgi:hypothetical protein